MASYNRVSIIYITMSC